ncbi:hypothetical protein [Acuticoccus sediminis]|uniref:hypothetical protein n=1 Tax=Acuticoccus sediminis TaxID=2184697 RepID=UPI001CFCECBC|nr:hypothetical protein [Acuticoccus sediminis]
MIRLSHRLALSTAIVSQLAVATPLLADSERLSIYRTHPDHMAWSSGRSGKPMDLRPSGAPDGPDTGRVVADPLRRPLENDVTRLLGEQARPSKRKNRVDFKPSFNIRAPSQRPRYATPDQGAPEAQGAVPTPPRSSRVPVPAPGSAPHQTAVPSGRMPDAPVHADEAPAAARTAPRGPRARAASIPVPPPSPRRARGIAAAPAHAPADGPALSRDAATLASPPAPLRRDVPRVHPHRAAAIVTAATAAVSAVAEVHAADHGGGMPAGAPHGPAPVPESPSETAHDTHPAPADAVPAPAGEARSETYGAVVEGAAANAPAADDHPAASGESDADQDAPTETPPQVAEGSADDAPGDGEDNAAHGDEPHKDDTAHAGNVAGNNAATSADGTHGDGAHETAATNGDAHDVAEAHAATEAHADAEGEGDGASHGEESHDGGDAPQRVDTTPIPPGPTPVQLIRMLTALQDDIARGSSTALQAQRVLNRRIGERFTASAPREWEDHGNARALVTYALSGGDPTVVRDVVRDAWLDEEYMHLAKGALAFSEGRTEDAKFHFKAVEGTDIARSILGTMRLAQAALVVGDDREEAMHYLDDARLNAPGTLVEEAALRRAILLASESDDYPEFEQMVDRYLRKFRSSVYAGNFRRRLAAAVTRMSFIKDPDAIDKLEPMLESMTVAGRQELYLLIARSAIETGSHTATQAAAARVLETAKPGTLDHARAELYQAAAEVVVPDRLESATAVLERLRSETLPDDDAALLKAALSLSRSVVTLPEPAMDLPVPPDEMTMASADGSGALEGAPPADPAAAPPDDNTAGDDPLGPPLDVERRVAAAVSSIDSLLETAE